MAIAGAVTEAQRELMFAHLPVGMSLTDEDDVFRFFAGATYSVCSADDVGRDLPRRRRRLPRRHGVLVTGGRQSRRTGL